MFRKVRIAAAHEATHLTALNDIQGKPGAQVKQAIRRRAGAYVTCAGAALLVLGLAGCSNLTMPYIPLVHPAPPDLTPAHDSAENLVRVDAELRTGCSYVEYIDKPAADVHSEAPQRWVAHTCLGELSYDVSTVQTSHGPVVNVTPVAGPPIDKPMNPHTIPAIPEDAASGTAGK